MLKLTNANNGEPIVIAARHFVAAFEEQTESGRRFTRVFTTSTEFLVTESLSEVGRQPAWQ